ncbi:unnamed protein product [Dovyalis caffra]|uniref:Uncharacterized protein n=1 Tax=Dovyalis caffra TaxID=77055 RepID=A0AAV1R7A1_9ROSI|nr:unnamed protein product [Dovyalis caffra]
METINEEEDGDGGDDDEGFSREILIYHVGDVPSQAPMCFFEKWRDSIEKKMEVAVMIMRNFRVIFIYHLEIYKVELPRQTPAINSGKVIDVNKDARHLPARITIANRGDHTTTTGALLVSLDDPAEPKDREAGLHRQDGL